MPCTPEEIERFQLYSDTHPQWGYLNFSMYFGVLSNLQIEHEMCNALENGDEEAGMLAAILLRLTEAERQALYERQW